MRNEVRRNVHNVRKQLDDSLMASKMAANKSCMHESKDLKQGSIFFMPYITTIYDDCPTMSAKGFFTSAHGPSAALSVTSFSSKSQTCRPKISFSGCLGKDVSA